ncbi:MAG: hypothetical protein A3C44_03355 [Gammaproteobacteria bacterium RIFCSPHIGHO2_02_FULL_39_13]|nr:MAG: hypothetical protein A3C44_03355 [Gammaproteobacteria bacterium RIFCSPHIGHO2_02_FULL_39_13]OGT48567.1 MAG: hypothetical protein A3E53_04245 [Gammaproteobacteria bacterium RIFCSPHIGHO2_12_FULL_39_24]
MAHTSTLSHRKFGFIFSGYFALLILVFILRHHAISDVVWFIFALCFLVACVAPTGLTPLKFLWDRVLKILGYINTRLLLGFLFFLIFTPIAVCKKLLEKDALGLQYDASCKTYRIPILDDQNDLRRPY